VDLPDCRTSPRGESPTPQRGSQRSQTVQAPFGGYRGNIYRTSQACTQITERSQMNRDMFIPKRGPTLEANHLPKSGIRSSASSARPPGAQAWLVPFPCPLPATATNQERTPHSTLQESPCQVCRIRGICPRQQQAAAPQNGWTARALAAIGRLFAKLQSPHRRVRAEVSNHPAPKDLTIEEIRALYILCVGASRAKRAGASSQGRTISSGEPITPGKTARKSLKGAK